MGAHIIFDLLYAAVVALWVKKKKKISLHHTRGFHKRPVKMQRKGHKESSKTVTANF